MSGPQIIDCVQNSDEWLRARLGIPTASMFHAILAKGEGKTRRSYMLRLAGEILTGEPSENFTTPDMDRGHAMEAAAREMYAFMHDVEPVQVGFVRNYDTGCSPDSLLGESGLLEIKTKRADILLDVILKDKFPPEHRPQCQGALMVCGREWIDLVCYWPRLPLFVKREYRDESYILALGSAVTEFRDELAATVKKLRHYGEVPRATIHIESGLNVLAAG